MYKPSYTQNPNPELAWDLIREFPLGLLVTQHQNQIQTNYYPLFLSRDDQGSHQLTGHMAKANPHWRNLGEEVSVHFLGPSAYISPTIYVQDHNVPTWNYAAVEIKGKICVTHEAAKIRRILNDSVSYFEARNGTDWTYNLEEAMKQKLESVLVGFEIKIVEVDAKFKLSHNRAEEDFRAVVDHFQKGHRPRDPEMLRWILKAGS
jgi:transcriptional regulator